MMSLIRRLHSASWAVLTADHFVPDLLYSPDIASSDNHLFQSLQNTLNPKEIEVLGRLHQEKSFNGKQNIRRTRSYLKITDTRTKR